MTDISLVEFPFDIQNLVDEIAKQIQIFLFSFLFHRPINFGRIPSKTGKVASWLKQNYAVWVGKSADLSENQRVVMKKVFSASGVDRFCSGNVILEQVRSGLEQEMSSLNKCVRDLNRKCHP